MSYEESRAKLHGWVGKIAIEAERLDHNLYEICVGILRDRGLDEAAATLLFKEYKAHGLREIWRKLMELQFPEQSEVIRRLDIALQDAANARNGSVHLLWFYDDEEDKFVGGKPRRNAPEIDYVELEKMGEVILHARHMISGFLSIFSFRFEKMRVRFPNDFELVGKNGIRRNTPKLSFRVSALFTNIEASAYDGLLGEPAKVKAKGQSKYPNDSQSIRRPIPENKRSPRKPR